MISVPGATFEYVDVGEGPALVLLHGGTGSIQEWGDSIASFSENFRVLAYHRRGFGGSTSRSAFPFNYHDTDVADLAAFLDALGLHRPVRLCGFSDGGTIVLMFAAQFPERVSAAVSVAGHIYVEKKTQEGLSKTRQMLGAAMERGGCDPTSNAIRSREAWFELWLAPDFRDWFNLEARLAQIACPTLVIQGTRDEYAGVDHARRIADGIKDARLLLVEGAKHWIHGGEYAKIFQDSVKAFFNDCNEKLA
jgi:pimeloyl-ACP methyl ester carboxylesterase